MQHVRRVRASVSREEMLEQHIASLELLLNAYMEQLVIAELSLKSISQGTGMAASRADKALRAMRATKSATRYACNEA